MMIAPAARAALTATLSMGCRLGDDILDCEKNGGVGPPEAVRRCGRRESGILPAPPVSVSQPAMRTRFILIQTSHAGNVGAAARAMKTMGFDDLVLGRRGGPTCCGGKKPSSGRAARWTF